MSAHLIYWRKVHHRLRYPVRKRRYRMNDEIRWFKTTPVTHTFYTAISPETTPPRKKK